MSNTSATTTTMNVNVDINVEDMAEAIGQLPPDLLVGMIRLVDSYAGEWATTRLLAKELNTLALEYLDEDDIGCSSDENAETYTFSEYDKTYKWIESEVARFNAILDKRKKLEAAAAAGDSADGD